MSPEVAVTAWAVWNAVGVSVDKAPVVGGGIGIGLAPWPDAPTALSTPARARSRPPRAAALVQLAQRVLAARRERFTAPDLPAVVDLRVGTVAGSRAFDLEFLQGLADRGDGFGSPSTFAYTLSTAVCGEVSLALGLRGALSTVSSGGASGFTALVTGAAQVAAGRSEACLCGRVELSGSDSDLIALFLLEAGAPVQVPRLTGWALAFDPEAAPAARPGANSTLEDLAAALAGSERVDLAASSPDGHSGVLTILPRSGLSMQGPAS